MEDDSNKKKVSEINEELMMDLIVDGVKKEGLELPPKPSVGPVKKGKKKIPDKSSEIKEKKRTKKNNKADYEILFFNKPDTNARDGKTVYIRPEFHERLTRIVRVIGEDKLTIYAYLDNLLEYHFKEFGEQIIKNFNDKYKPIL
ncbi:DUF3408 domain-containing protein [Salegentibacter sp. Hel_I_6]|uniref:DUF3408 domain-containing protein n=1 Tax=Salegentibacter sp. Hel_I_6 TaxID=1250278 RepID=UPI0005624EF9|nr:DUF3408 domain-containing protein [Salegentibacter sp. Hel_I_6]